MDRAYILHSPMMNKEMFYVGLTRHVKKVECFIAKEDITFLSDLKRQAYRETPKETTLDYITSHELQKQRHLEALKTSDSMLDQAKRIGLSLLQEVRTHVIEPYLDKRPDHKFFNPKIEQSNQEAKAFVEESDSDTLKPKQPIIQTPPIKEAKQKEITISHKLSTDKENLIKDYFKWTESASSLHAVVKSHEEGPHVQEWQKICGERNASAYKIVQSFKPNEIRSIFKNRGFDLLYERAAKHEYVLHREHDHQNLDIRLKEHLEPLLLKLFPEGPTKRDSKSLRFGNKGSLAVTFTGPKTGCFFDFENQAGGGPLQLIQKSMGYSHAESVKWAREFLGESHTIKIPTQFIFRKTEQEQEWNSLKPEKPAPSLKELSYHLNLTYQEKARYTYRDENGQILFHTLRLEDEQAKKIILPLSFGCYQDGIHRWSLKGYQVEKKPLYNLHLVKKYPKAKVLIVEGGKTADAASKLFDPKKMICLTWFGGAGAVEKSNWHPLFMREIVIWPDNDKAGFEASNAICKELRRVGIKFLHEVSRTLLAQELPPKWDLADPLPHPLGEKFIKDAILRANERGVGLNTLMGHLKGNGLQVNPITAHQVLIHVEEKLRPTLEQTNERNVQSLLLKSTLEILRDQNQIKAILSNSKGAITSKYAHFFANNIQPIKTNQNGLEK